MFSLPHSVLTFCCLEASPLTLGGIQASGSLHSTQGARTRAELWL